jgi:hypothetical protein
MFPPASDSHFISLMPAHHFQNIKTSIVHVVVGTETSMNFLVTARRVDGYKDCFQ